MAAYDTFVQPDALPRRNAHMATTGGLLDAVVYLNHGPSSSRTHLPSFFLSSRRSQNGMSLPRFRHRF
jgi:hypothetical protein